MKEKGREFKAVCLLRDSQDASMENYSQFTFNPRLHLIEYSSYLELQQQADMLAGALEFIRSRTFSEELILNDEEVDVRMARVYDKAIRALRATKNGRGRDE